MSEEVWTPVNLRDTPNTQTQAAAASLADGRVTDALYSENSYTKARSEGAITQRCEEAGYHKDEK